MPELSDYARGRFVRPVTPAELSDGLKALILQIAPGQSPAYVNAAPLPGEVANECFGLVNRCVREHGGEAVIGWSLWEFPTLFVEAEFHAVWRKPDGTLVDVSSRPPPTARVLFLRDPARQSDGRSIDNVRVPIRQDPTPLEYLATFAAKFEIMNRGARADQHGEIHLVGDEADEFRDLMTRQAILGSRLAASYPVVGPYHPCPCGSGKKVKWCCWLTR